MKIVIDDAIFDGLKIFSEFGIPLQLKTDNGPPFNSGNFAQYLNFMGVRHRKITPLWPQANAETERFMRTIKKVVRGKPMNWKQEMNKLLLSYRATPHSTTGVPPATLLFGRDIKTKLPSVPPQKKLDDVRGRDCEQKEKMKYHADKKQNVKASGLEVGDNVLIKTVGVRKSLNPYEPEPLKIVDKKGSMITAEKNGQRITRNSSFFKRSPQATQEHDMDPGDTQQERDDQCRDCMDTNVQEPEPDSDSTIPVPSDNTQRYTRPQRSIKMPKRFADYVCK